MQAELRAKDTEHWPESVHCKNMDELFFGLRGRRWQKSNHHVLFAKPLWDLSHSLAQAAETDHANLCSLVNTLKFSIFYYYIA